MLKVIHVITSISNASGGTSTYMKLLIEALHGKLAQSLLAFDAHDNVKIKAKVDFNLIQRNCFSTFYSKELKKNLNLMNGYIFHGNGLWQLAVHEMAKNARKKNKPYIISPHGMLEPWALKQGLLKKKLALKLFQYNDLLKATCLHATAPMEVKSIRKLGLKNPVAMIPNGVNISEFPAVIPVKTNEPKKILFLSRIHPKKGIELLIQAWSQIDKKLCVNWQIEIIGNGEESYINDLKLQINELKLQQQIIIKPPVFGKEKVKTFREASLFVLPTYSENFGIVVAEALASYTPVITTKGTPWEELNTHQAGWWIDIGIAPLKHTLEVALKTKGSELITLGKNGRKLIEDKYSMEAVANQMLELYKWVVTKENKPDFVFLE